VWFANYQKEIEKRLNETLKFRNQIGDLRIRKENDGLPKELRRKA
jgi:hypothetical protein